MSEVQAISLALTEWQIRMIKDYVKIRTPFSKVFISVIDKRQWVMYRQPIRADLNKGVWNLYLTDAQIKRVASRLGANVQISALKISPEMVKSGVVAFK